MEMFSILMSLGIKIFAFYIIFMLGLCNKVMGCHHKGSFLVHLLKVIFCCFGGSKTEF